MRVILDWLFCCFTSLDYTTTKTNVEDKTKTYIPIFRRRCRFLYIALLRSYTVPCYSLLLVFRPMYVYKSVLMYMLISMGLFRSFSVLHVRIIRRRRYDAVMHS